MSLFKDELIEEFMDWKMVNPNTFSWWSFVNMKADLQTALGFARFFYPDIIEVGNCFLLKDKFDKDLFDSWKKECSGDKTCIEKMMNLYEVKDFFHINMNDDKNQNQNEQVKVLGEVLKLFWTLSFKHRFPNRNIIVDVSEEEDHELFITVYENLIAEVTS